MSSMNPNWFQSESPFGAATTSTEWDKTNPFFVAPEASDVEMVAANGETEYALVAAVPLTSSDEFESYDDAVLVTVAWGSNALLAKQVSAGQSLVLGDETTAFVLPETMGMEKWPLIIARPGVGTRCVIPANVTGIIEIDGRAVTLETAKREHALTPSSELPGAFELELRQGAHVRMEIEGGLVVTVRAERAGKKLPVTAAGSFIGSIADKYVALSLVAHLSILGMIGGLMPKMNADDAEEISRDNLLVMQHMLEASAEVEMAKQMQQDESGGTNQNDSSAGGSGKQTKEDEGKLGAKSAPSKNAQYAVLKQNDGPKTLSRREELELAANFGLASMLGTLATQNGNNSPSAPWETEANGHHDKAKMGNMFGETIDDAQGAGGLGLTSTGIGGGGPWDGIGLGNMGDLGNGGGDRPGQGGNESGNGGPGEKGGPGGMGNCKPGSAAGCNVRLGDHKVKVPRLMNPYPATVLGGHLPADVIQRVVRMNFGRFRSCYDAGLRTNPSLQGRIATKFVIGRDGSVSLSQDSGSDMPDSTVKACVVRAFQGLSFPSPEGGIVTVTYPIMFSPGS